MLNQDVVRIAQERIQLEIAEQTASLREEVDRIKNQMTARGSLQSGGTISLIVNACILVIKNRVQLIWQTFFRFFTTSGLTYYDRLAEDLKILVAQYLPEQMTDIKALVEENSKLIRMPDLFNYFEPKLDMAREAALSKAGTEIDLFVHSLKSKIEMKKKDAASTIFNIYSPIGAIQTGDSSIANIAQTIDADIKQQLDQVLEEISVGLTQSDVATPYPKREIIELVQEGQAELKKPSPNITKLRTTLLVVGTSIQTIASMKPAYQTLKQALTFLGISLP